MVRKVGTTSARSITGSASSDAVAEVGAERRRLLQHAERVGRHRRAVGRLAGERDAERAGVGADLVEEGAGRRRGDVGIARRRAGGRIEQRRAVADRERYRVLDGEPAEGLAEVGRHGVARPGRAQADQPAGGRRRADGAETVRGMGDRQHARRHGRRGAAAGARRRPLQVPGVAGGAVELRLAGEAEAKLAAARLAVDHHARLLEPGDVEAVRARGRQVGEEAAAPRGPGTGERGAEILEQEGHAGERTVRQARFDGLRGEVVTRSSMTTALMAGLRFSTRAMAASNTSVALTSPALTSAASPSASYDSYSAKPLIGRLPPFPRHALHEP